MVATNQPQCEALCVVRTTSRQTFYVSCAKAPDHKGDHETTFVVDEGFEWRVTWNESMARFAQERADRQARKGVA